MNTYITTSRNGLPALQIETEDFEAEILFQGAHFTRFKSKSLNRKLFWLSQGESFEGGRSIRGGVPIVFPWFGPHADEENFPRHGFARNLGWQLVGEPRQENLETVVEFLLLDSPVTVELFPFKFRALLTMRLSANGVRMNLSIRNTDEKPFQCEALFHPYFAVNSLETVQVSGLDGKQYFDKVLNTTGNTQRGSVSFPENIDRVYSETEGPFVISDEGKPSVRISQTGIQQTVVWNPGGGTTKVSAGNTPSFVCVEPGCVFEGRLNLEPGQEDVLGVQFTLLE